MNQINHLRHTVITMPLLIAGGLATNANVRINEICADSSDRLLRWSDDNRARLGSGASWYEAEFDAQYWKTANGPLGYNTSGITTDLAEEMGTTASLYLRQTFSVSAANAASSQNIILDVDYNDGFVAYLNGVEILRKNTGGTGAFCITFRGLLINTHPDRQKATRSASPPTCCSRV